MKNKILLKKSDIEINPGLNIDPSGFVFRYKNKFYRAIKNDKKDELHFLFNSGAITELNNLNLIPKTFISEFSLEEYDLVLEHELIDRLILPTEWSFTMLKDAALLIIKVNKVLKKYGYETHDGHGFNVMFHYAIPKFVDIGSFCKKRGKKYWSGRDNFNEFFLYSLYMWSKGNVLLAKSFLVNDGKYLTSKEYEFFVYKYSLARWLPSKYLEKFFFLLKHLRNIQKIDIENVLIVKKENLKRNSLRFLLKLSKYGLIPNNHTNFNKLENQINKFSPPTIDTEWGEYHTNYSVEEHFAPETRFFKISKLVQDLNMNSLLEIAGNQGILSEELSRHVPSVICSDIDEKAVDHMYRRIQKNKSQVYPALLDFLSPINQSLYYSDKNTVWKRYKSEVVLALALTHHLILTRKTPLNNIFEALLKYTHKYILVEFMPLGLRRGPVPKWYNIDWFRNNFNNYFNLLEELPSEKDGSRILFIGEKR